MLKVAIVGLGHLHPRLYMPLFQAVPETEVTAVVEPDRALREAFCSDFRVRGFDSIKSLLRDCKPDIAAIFLPHDECPAAAQACAAAGCHLMVEKPMASDPRGAAAIVQAARKAGVKATTGYCWRMHPVARRMKELVSSGVLGRIVGAEGRCAAGRLHRYIEGHSPWMLEKARSGGGPMCNLGVHWIDLFRWMLEDEVVEVTGENVKVNTEYDIEDNSFALLRFSRGAIASLGISYTVPDTFPCGRDLFVALRGTRGVASWAPAFEGQKDVLFVCASDGEYAVQDGRRLEYALEPVKGYAGIMGLDYLRDFVRAVERDEKPAISAEDGLAALKVVEAVYRSAESRSWTRVS